MADGWTHVAKSLLESVARFLRGGTDIADPSSTPISGGPPISGEPPISGGRRIDEIERGDGPAWGTLSGLTAHPTNPERLYAVTDKNSPPVRILEIDVSGPAPRVVHQLPVAAPETGSIDPEAIVTASEGGFWVASEGRAGEGSPNVLLEVDATGHVRRSIYAPESISGRVRKKGIEGIAIDNGPTATHLYVAFQAPLTGDPDGVTRIAAVDLADGQWTFFYYPLEATASGEFTGLSDLVHLGDRRFAAIERDGKSGRKAIKWITTFDIGSSIGASPDDAPALLTKQLALDLVPVFTEVGRKLEAEIEGLTVAADGQVYAVTDNDNERPTLLLRLGAAKDLFRP